MTISARLIFGIAAGVCLLGAANATTLTFGLPAVSADGNCIPFSCPTAFGLTAFQQVYSAASFSSPFDINDIEFFDTQLFNGQTTLADGTYTLDLSETSQSVGGLDLTAPSNNLGIDNQVFYSGSLPSVSNHAVIFSGTPYVYDPAAGNLLLTVTFTGAADLSGVVYLDQSGSATATTFAAFTAGAAYQEDGLVTSFVGGGAPEPSTLVLLALPLGLLYFNRRRRSIN